MSTPKPPTTKPVIINTKTLPPPPSSFPNPLHGNATWHTLLSSPETPTSSLSAGIATLPPKTGHLARHRHMQAEIYYLTEGEGKVFISGREYEVGPGSVVFIPGDAEHGVVNWGEGELRWVYVFPGGRFGDVVYRFSKL